MEITSPTATYRFFGPLVHEEGLPLGERSQIICVQGLSNICVPNVYLQSLLEQELDVVNKRFWRRGVSDSFGFARSATQDL